MRDRARSVAAAARQLGSAGHDLLLRAARNHQTVEPLAWLVVETAIRLEPADPFVQQATDQVISSVMQTGIDVYLIPLLDHYAKGVTRDTYSERIQLLCFKLSRIGSDDIHLPPRGSIADPPEYSTDVVLGKDVLFASLRRCLVQALSEAGEFVKAGDLLDAVSILPTAMRERFRSWILATFGFSDGQLLVNEVFQAIKSRLPTGDDVSLVDAAVRTCRPEEYADLWATALGDPPSITEVGAALAVRRRAQEMEAGRRMGGNSSGRNDETVG